MIDNYNDLTLGTYLEIDKVVTGDAEEIDKQVRIIALLADISEDDILAMPLGEYGQMAAKTAFLREEVPPVTAPDRVIVGDRAYIPTRDFTKITTAQYVDFQTFSKGGVPMLSELLSALLIPEGHKYNDGYDTATVVQDIRSLPVPVAIALAGFFFARLLGSIADSLTSLTGLLPKMSKKRREEMTKAIAEMRAQLAGVGLQM